MKRFAAQYIITGTGKTLKRGVITTTDSGVITEVMDTGGDLRETSSTPFYNGIIVPGFVNCHTHTELSDMYGLIPGGEGLGNFIGEVRRGRNPSPEKAVKAIEKADSELYARGTSAVADICNTALSFGVKEKSHINYVTLLEIFGIDPEKAERRIEEIVSLKIEADKYRAPAFIVPHSVYSISVPLFEKLAPLLSGNSITSIHFLESEQERMMLSDLSGPMIESYAHMGITSSMLEKRAGSHPGAIEDYMPRSGNLILVHNTFIRSKEIETLLAMRKNIYWCLCPNSNLFIEKSLPPIHELRKHNADIVLGTDSLASNNSLNLLNELITISVKFPEIALKEIIGWATLNGARALNMNHLGTIETGKTPGLVLLENCDLEKIRLTENSSSRRLI